MTPDTPDLPDTPKYTAEQFINALRKAGAGMTKEQADAWKADIDRGRHPQLYCQKCGASLESDTPAEPPSALKLQIIRSASMNEVDADMCVRVRVQLCDLV